MSAYQYSYCQSQLCFVLRTSSDGWRCKFTDTPFENAVPAAPAHIIVPNLLQLRGERSRFQLFGDSMNTGTFRLNLPCADSVE